MNKHPDCPYSSEHPPDCAAVNTHPDCVAVDMTQMQTAQSDLSHTCSRHWPGFRGGFAVDLGGQRGHPCHCPPSPARRTVHGCGTAACQHLTLCTKRSGQRTPCMIQSWLWQYMESMHPSQLWVPVESNALLSTLRESSVPVKKKSASLALL